MRNLQCTHSTLFGEADTTADMGFCRNILNAAFLLLNTLLILLGATSLGIAAGQWTSVVSDDVTLSELIATHAQYTRALIALFLILGGCLVLVGLAGLVTAILLLANRLKGTAGQLLWNLT